MIRRPREPRVFLVDVTTTRDAEATQRLVRAKSATAATAHVAARTIRCRPATLDEAHSLGAAGVEIETAGEGDEPADHDPAGAAPGEG